MLRWSVKKLRPYRCWGLVSRLMEVPTGRRRRMVVRFDRCHRFAVVQRKDCPVPARPVGPSVRLHLAGHPDRLQNLLVPPAQGSGLCPDTVSCPDSELGLQRVVDCRLAADPRSVVGSRLEADCQKVVDSRLAAGRGFAAAPDSEACLCMGCCPGLGRLAYRGPVGSAFAPAHMEA